MDLNNIEYDKPIFSGIIEYKKVNQNSNKTVQSDLEVISYFEQDIEKPYIYEIRRNDEGVVEKRAFKIPFTSNIAKDKYGFMLWLKDLRESIYHELLHAIDPKIEDIELFHNDNWGRANNYVRSNENMAAYRNQLLEKDVTLSAIARNIVDQNNIDFLKTNINSEEFIKDNLPNHMDSTNNRKEFAKLLWYYFNEKITNV